MSALHLLKAESNCRPDMEDFAGWTVTRQYDIGTQAEETRSLSLHITMTNVSSVSALHPQLQDRTWYYRQSTQRRRAETRRCRCTRLLMYDELIAEPESDSLISASEIQGPLARKASQLTLKPVEQT